jgi:hypothetical protein
MASRSKDAGRAPSQTAATAPEAETGVVLLGAIYTVGELKRRLGWSDAALRAARRRGLRVLRTGKRAFVAGNDLLEFLRQEADKDK